MRITYGLNKCSRKIMLDQSICLVVCIKVNAYNKDNYLNIFTQDIRCITEKYLLFQHTCNTLYAYKISI